MNKSLLALAFVAGAVAAQAAEFGSIGSLSQGEFQHLAEDLGATFSYKGVTPATPLGMVGFDVGIEVTDTALQNSDLFARAGSRSRSHLIVPKLHVHKGLFGGLDIGAFVGGASQVNAAVFGADLRYALLDDTLTMPAVAVRVSGTKATGLGSLALATAAIDVMASKKFTALTPYIGAGVVRVQAKADAGALAEERFNKGRVFGGLNVNLVGANLAFEVEQAGSNTSLSAKVGVRF